VNFDLFPLENIALQSTANERLRKIIGFYCYQRFFLLKMATIMVTRSKNILQYVKPLTFNYCFVYLSTLGFVGLSGEIEYG